MSHATNISEDDPYDSSLLNRLLESEMIKHLTVIVLAIATFFFHFFMLTKVPWMSYGIDGAYYDLQVRSILESGLPYHLDPPLVFYYQALWAVLLGDVALGIKVGMALMVALTVPTSYLFFRLISKRYLVAWIGSFMLAFDPLMIVLVNGHYKNLAGLPFMFAFFYFYVRATRHERRSDIILALGFLCATFMTHIFPSGLIMIGVGVHWLYSLAQEKQVWIPETRTIGKIGLGLIGALTAVFVVYPDALSKFSKIVSFATSLTESEIEAYALFDWLMFFIGPQAVYLFLTVGGLVLITHDLIRNHVQRGMAIMLAIGLAEVILSSPLISMAWRVRFSFLFFIPSGFALAYLVSRASGTSRFAVLKKPKIRNVMTLIIVIIVCSCQLTRGIQATRTANPVIPPPGYDDLVFIADNNLVPEDGIAYSRFGVHYWIMLLVNVTPYTMMDDAFEAARSAGADVYVFNSPDSRPLPPIANLIYEGAYFHLFSLPPPPTTS